MTAMDLGPGRAGWVTVDPTTRAAVNIGYDECRTNEGHHFFVADFISVSVGGTLLFTIDTPPEPVPCLKSNVFSRNILCLEIYEGVTNVTGGTPLTPINSKRTSDIVSDLTIKINPTATLPAKLAGFLYDESGGIVLSQDNLILKPETTYAIKIVPMADPPAVVNADVGYYFRWSE